MIFEFRQALALSSVVLLLCSTSYASEHANCNEGNRYPPIPSGEDFLTRYDRYCDTDRVGATDFINSFREGGDNFIKGQFFSAQHDNYSEYGNFIWGAFNECRGNPLWYALGLGHAASMLNNQGALDSAAGQREITAGYTHSEEVAQHGGVCEEKNSVQRDEPPPEPPDPEGETGSGASSSGGSSAFPGRIVPGVTVSIVWVTDDENGEDDEDEEENEKQK